MKNLTEKPPLQPLIFFKMDQAGYFINESDIKNIKKPWLDPIEDMKQIFPKYFADQLHSVYIFGEFAKPKVMKEPVDFWVMVVTKGQMPVDWLEDYKKYLIERYPIATKLQIKTQAYEHVISSESFKFSIKHEYVCIYGSNIALITEKFKPGPRLFFKTMVYEGGLPVWVEYVLANIEKPETIKFLCSFICSATLQAGFEICIEREKKYTRDLYTCYRVFSKYYPDKELLMRKVYYFSKEPTNDPNQLLEMINGIGKWLLAIIRLNMAESEIRNINQD